jgi:hypothetical protein
MMEIPGFAPRRRVEQEGDIFRVYVKPADFMGLPEVCVELNADQYDRYRQWRNRQMMIQEALPELTNSEREKLMSGLGDEDFHRITNDKEND